MKKTVKLLMIILVVVSLSGCVSEYYQAPDLKPTIVSDCVNPGLISNKSVADIWTIAPNPTVPSTPAGNEIPNTPTYANDDIIEGYVISSDEGGNFYKSMYFQPLDKSRGFNLSTDLSSAYINDYIVGRKVFLKMKGLAYCNPTSFATGLTFGGKPTDKYNVDRLSVFNTKKVLVPSCDFINEDLLVNGGLTLSQIKNPIYLNTLVEIKGVQFRSQCATYSKKDFDTSMKITDGVLGTSSDLDLRTSRFANFAGKYLPSGNGTIRGVLTKYGSGYQIVIRTERDVKFDNPRIATTLPVKVGASLVYTGSFSEDFSSYAAFNSNFPKYVNDAVIGTKYWEVKEFSSNKYLEMSAYNNDCGKAYFIVPVDMTIAKSFSFKTKDGYNNGNPLKVYYSLNYMPSSNVNQAELKDITNNFVYSTGTTSGYASNFTSSGVFGIPESILGNGYFIFEYDGTNGITTTIQIDDIKVN